MKNILIIDDMRSDFDIFTDKEVIQAIEENVPRDNIVIARSFEMGIKLLEAFRWDVLYLDHDLGGQKTGYDVIKWIEEELHTNMGYIVVPKQMICVSSNGPGIQRIKQGWAQIQKKLIAVMLDKASS